MKKYFIGYYGFESMGKYATEVWAKSYDEANQIYNSKKLPASQYTWSENIVDIITRFKEWKITTQYAEIDASGELWINPLATGFDI